MTTDLKQVGTTTQKETASDSRPEAQLPALTAVKIFAFGLIAGILLFKLDFGLTTKDAAQSYPADRVHEAGDHKYSQPATTPTPESHTGNQQPATNDARVVYPSPSVSKNDDGNDVNLLMERVKTLEQRIQEQDRHVDTAMPEETEKITALRAQLDHITGKRREDQQTIAELNRLNRQLQEKVARTQETISPSKLPVQPIPAAAPVAPPPVTKADPLQDGKTAYTSGNYAEAITMLKPLAEQGGATAQYLLGLMYRNGQGVLANNDTARAWMLKSARQGFRDAQLELAKFYAQGINGVTDPFLAYTWYLVAEKNGKYDFISARAGLETKLQREMLTQAAALAEQLHNTEHAVSAAPDVNYRSTTTNQ